VVPGCRTLRADLRLYGTIGEKADAARYEALEKMDDGEFVEADDTSIGGGGPTIIPCNWLQHFENVVDPYHVPVLHGSFSGPQFTNMMASMPEVKFETSLRGGHRTFAPQPGRRQGILSGHRGCPATLRVVPNPRVAQFAPVESIGWDACRSMTLRSHLRRRPSARCLTGRDVDTNECHRSAASSRLDSDRSELRDPWDWAPRAG